MGLLTLEGLDHFCSLEILLYIKGLDIRKLFSSIKAKLDKFKCLIV